MDVGLIIVGVGGETVHMFISRAVLFGGASGGYVGPGGSRWSRLDGLRSPPFRRRLIHVVGVTIAVAGL